MRIKVLKLNNEPRIFWSLVSIILFCLVFYAYNINQTVYNVIERQNFELKISDLRSKVGSLESQYIGLKSKINLKTAYSLGFKETLSSDFVNKSSLGKSISLNNEI